MKILERIIRNACLVCLVSGLAAGVPGQESETPKVSRVLTIADPGVPRIIWDGPRAIRVYGHHILLNGFRFSGHSTRLAGVARPFDEPNGRYVFDDQIQGMSLPTLSKEHPELWLAVFAASEPVEPTATIRFVPFFKVVSYNVDSHELIYESSIGPLIPNYWAGTDVLVCKENKVYSNRLIKIRSNSMDVLVLDAKDQRLQLFPGDYLLPAPGPGCDYKYLRTLKLDYSPSIPTGEHGEWRNFVFSEGRTYSYHGNPFGDIRDTSFREIDFSHHVSPLATGVVGTLNAFVRSESGGSAGISLCHDGSNHVIASTGVDRTHSYGDGHSSPFMAAFGRKQSLWAKVNGKDVTGRIVIQGWVED